MALIGLACCIGSISRSEGNNRNHQNYPTRDPARRNIHLHCLLSQLSD
jgi:hypothetical protein